MFANIYLAVNLYDDSFRICHLLPLNQVNFSLAEKKNRKKVRSIYNPNVCQKSHYDKYHMIQCMNLLFLRV